LAKYDEVNKPSKPKQKKAIVSSQPVTAVSDTLLCCFVSVLCHAVMSVLFQPHRRRGLDTVVKTNTVTRIIYVCKP